MASFARAVAHYQHRHLVFARVIYMDLLAAFTRCTVQMALAFAGSGKEDLIRLDDPLRAVGFSGAGKARNRWRQRKLVFLSIPHCLALALTVKPSTSHAVIQPLSLMPQTGQRASRYGRERVLARATAETLQLRLASPTIEAIRLADRTPQLKRILTPLHDRSLWRHLVQAMCSFWSRLNYDIFSIHSRKSNAFMTTPSSLDVPIYWANKSFQRLTQT